MIRHEGAGDPGSMRILRARGDSMEPGIFDGDRMLVDVSRRRPATGETAVLWDGSGLVVKNVEVVPHAEPPRIRLLYLRSETDMWFEITNLVIPGENDGEAQIDAMTGWVVENLGSDVPMHFSAFHPDYRMLDNPRSPFETLVSTAARLCTGAAA